jgi:hypothetical protein
MINFDRWLRNRNKPGTIEYTARHSRKRNYQLSVAAYKIMLLAEMFVGNGGNIGLLAEEIGIHRNSISRLFKGAGFDKKKLLEVAKSEEPK